MRLLTKRLRLTIEVCVLSLKGSRNCSLHDPSFVLKTQEGGHQSLQEPWQHWRRVLRSQALQPVTWQQSLPVVLWDVWRAPALHWESEDHILGASSKCMQSNRHMIYIYNPSHWMFCLFRLQMCLVLEVSTTNISWLDRLLLHSWISDYCETGYDFDTRNQESEAMYCLDQLIRVDTSNATWLTWIPSRLHPSHFHFKKSHENASDEDFS